MTPNLDDSLRFYGSLFGWMHLTGHDDQGSAYSMQRLGDLDVAGGWVRCLLK
jgi:predicted enzyme related to lactoylglutathione lyase